MAVFKCKMCGDVWVGEFRNDRPWNGNGVCFIGDYCYDGPLRNGRTTTGRW